MGDKAVKTQTSSEHPLLPLTCVRTWDPESRAGKE